jgi:hypothetical protein
MSIEMLYSGVSAGLATGVLTVQNKFALIGWWTPHALPGTKMALGVHDVSGTRSWDVYIDGADNKVTFYHRDAAAGTRTIKSTTVLSANVPVHVAAVADGAGYVRLYINGYEESNAAYPNTTYAPANSSLKICQENGSTYCFDGEWDDIRYFYNYALTPEEVASIFWGGYAAKIADRTVSTIYKPLYGWNAPAYADGTAQASSGAGACMDAYAGFIITGGGTNKWRGCQIQHFPRPMSMGIG